MQHLAGPNKVRYLAENAGSMDPIHFTAFCQLLKLDPKDPNTYGMPSPMELRYRGDETFSVDTQMLQKLT